MIQSCPYYSGHYPSCCVLRCSNDICGINIASSENVRDSLQSKTRGNIGFDIGRIRARGKVWVEVWFWSRHLMVC